MLLLVLPAPVTLGTYKISIHFCGLQSPPGSLRRKQTVVKPSRCPRGLENIRTEKTTELEVLFPIHSFPITPASRQGTFFLLTLLCQTPSRTAKGWPAVMVGTALGSPWTPDRSMVLCVPRMLWCYPGRTRVQTQASRQTCCALYCTC